MPGLLGIIGVMTLVLTSPALAVSIDWAHVGAPGNAADATTGQGAVAYNYRISKYETTNTQYAEFLNAVATDDPKALYAPDMGSGYGGITRSGQAGNYSYATIAGRGNHPVNHVSWYSSIRFANWLHNGQPNGGQTNATTEDGAYTITKLGIANLSIQRNPNASIFLPDQDEWYKAAYYDTVSDSYFEFPTSSNTTTTCAFPGATPNTANCNYMGPGSELAQVGSYTASTSPNGTFDQGGNVMEYGDTTQIYVPMFGYAFAYQDFYLSSSLSGGSTGPRDQQHFSLGFRVASRRYSAVPEPSTALLLAFGLMGLAKRPLSGQRKIAGNQIRN